MEKKISFNTSVYDLVTTYPEIKEIMINIGFKDLGNPAMLNTVGRYVTINKGATMKKIPLEKIKAAFETAGFIVEEN